MKDIRIEVRDVSFTYGDRQAKAAGRTIGKLSFFAENGESIGLVGANGAGKSTFLKMLVGLELPDEGEIWIGGRKLEKKNLADIRENVGYIFQDSDNQLFMTTVGEDVSFGPRNYGLPEKEVQERTATALEKCGISHLKERPVYRLSGGEKKLAAIATVLSMSPDILLMDEPSAALDPRNRRRLISIIRDLPQMKILAGHDLDFIWDTTSRVVLVDGGKIVADGRTEDILRDEKLLLSHGLELPLSIAGR